MTYLSLESHRKLQLMNKWIGKNLRKPIMNTCTKCFPQHCEYTGKLSNHQDTNQKRRFQKCLLTTKIVSTSHNSVGHTDQLEGNNERTNLTKTHFWWSKWTSRMEHNIRTNCRPRRRNAFVWQLGTTINLIPEPRLYFPAINSGNLHPVRPE